MLDHIPRALETYFQRWSNCNHRLPLIVRGARQVGKTHLIETIGKSHFQNLVIVNFELHPQLISAFDSLEPKTIISKLEVLLNQSISMDNTLLFLDEIQECPNALMALRYFKEKMPALAIVSAGSLLEFTLEQENFRMPVGRVQQVHLGPLSFLEFLTAINQSQRAKYLETLTLDSDFDQAIHEALLENVRHYLYVGGMPGVLQVYSDTHSFSQASSRQNAIIQSFQEDFGKYAKHTQIQHLQKLYQQIPSHIGGQIKFSHIDPDRKARDLKANLSLFAKAKLISEIHSTNASGVPLGAELNSAFNKLLWLDVGLLQNACGLEMELINPDLKPSQINQGRIAEQFVGQELLAYQNPEKIPGLYFWQRNKRSSTAEVDYVITKGHDIFPVEVKAGTTGRLKSLQIFIEEKSSPFGIRISERPLSFENNILSVPFYLISQLDRLILDQLKIKELD